MVSLGRKEMHDLYYAVINKCNITDRLIFLEDLQSY
jgi:hypothetical protein